MCVHSEYGKRYECVCLVSAQYLVVLSANHIPLPESAEQKDWWKDKDTSRCWSMNATSRSPARPSGCGANRPR